MPSRMYLNQNTVGAKVLAAKNTKGQVEKDVKLKLSIATVDEIKILIMMIRTQNIEKKNVLWPCHHYQKF